MAPGLQQRVKQWAEALLGDELGGALRRQVQGRRLARGDYDRIDPELAMLERFVSPGMSVADVGANIGVYSRRLAALVGPQGRVHAFEPVPAVYAALLANAARFPDAQVVTYHAAVLDRAGLTTIEVPDIPNRHYRAQVSDSPAPSSSCFVVQAIRLDDLRPSLGELGLLKCDVEGAELRVLEGARELIESCRPVLLLEVQDSMRQFGDEPAELFGWLAQRGYRAMYCDGRDLVPCEGLAPDNPGPNYFFVPR